MLDEGPAEVTKGAKSTPNHGSVTQSADGSDVVQATLDYSNDANDPTLVATINGVRQKPADYTHIPGSGVSVTKSRGTYQASSFYSGEDYDNNPATDTWLVVEVITDSTGSADTDYLVAGLWAVISKNSAEPRLLNIGAFVDGNDKFNQSNLQGLRGSATYIGDAYGAYATSSSAGFVDGTTTLTAEFGDASELGTISGRIDNVKFSETGTALPNNPILTLNQANIGSSNHGFFSGPTSMTYNSEIFSGKWGGQFFGNNGNNQPGTVAGTFGGATADGNAAFLGVFAADRQ